MLSLTKKYLLLTIPTRCVSIFRPRANSETHSETPSSAFTLSPEMQTYRVQHVRYLGDWVLVSWTVLRPHVLLRHSHSSPLFSSQLSLCYLTQRPGLTVDSSPKTRCNPPYSNSHGVRSAHLVFISSIERFGNPSSYVVSLLWWYKYS